MSFLSALRFGWVKSTALAASFAIAIGACGATGDDPGIKGDATGSGGGFITGAGGAGGGSLTTGSATVASSSSGDGGGGSDDHGPYPFVLAHGFFGFEDFAGLGFETYFYGVKDYLKKKGEIVDTPAVDPFNSSSVRGQQLTDRIKVFLAATGAKKVNIIGHSQGGLDARVVAHDHPELVASVVTVGTPHYGSPVADVALKLLADPNAQKVIDELVKLLGGPLYDQIDQATSLTKGLQQFSKQGIADFNAKYTDSPSVFYASVGGRSAAHLLDDDCIADVVVPFVKPWESQLDPMDPLLYFFGLVLAGDDNAANDGLVRARDSIWGEYWGCVPADHLDEVGQLLGDDAGLGNSWDHQDFYWQIISYLRSKGY